MLGSQRVDPNAWLASCCSQAVVQRRKTAPDRPSTALALALDAPAVDAVHAEHSSARDAHHASWPPRRRNDLSQFTKGPLRQRRQSAASVRSDDAARRPNATPCRH